MPRVLFLGFADAGGKPVPAGRLRPPHFFVCREEYFQYSGNMKTTEAVDSLAALAHSGRLGIFRLLVKAGPNGAAAGNIARRLRSPPSTLSANLTVLANAGLVESRRDGRSIIYTARYDRMGELLTFLIADCCAGSNVICAPLTGVLKRVSCCG
jgi:DNA-binding transcriptional ArsR family regulator